MPDHKTHFTNTKKRLGDPYVSIHRFLDKPYHNPILRPRHRLLFHDEVTPFLLSNIISTKFSSISNNNDYNGKKKKRNNNIALEILLATISHYIDDFPELNKDKTNS